MGETTAPRDRLSLHFSDRQPAYALADSALMRSVFLSDQERAALANAMMGSRTAYAGTELLRERDATDNLFILTRGWACRYKMTRDGHRQIPALLLAGDFCNLDSMLLTVADYGVRTLTEVALLILPRDRALALCTQHPGIARTLTRLAFVENVILSQWAVCLGRRSAREQMAHLLCELEVRLAKNDRSNTGSFGLPMTQEQLGDVLGLTSVHVNRTLRLLVEEGVIVRQGRVITIPDIARLRTIAEFDPAYLHDEREALRTPASMSSVQSRPSMQLDQSMTM